MKQSVHNLPPTPWGELPPRMQVLFIAGDQRTGGWLAEALAADNASQVDVEECTDLPDGLARLRDNSFDAVLISHEGASFDALKVLDAIRTGSSEDQPILVLGQQREPQLADLCFESGADAYLCVDTTTVRTMIWQLGRAMERRQLLSENRRLQYLHERQLRVESDEAGRLLQQQRTLISARTAIAPDLWQGTQNTQLASQQEWQSEECPRADLPAGLVQHYRELLQAYVIMGVGNLDREMGVLVDLLVTTGVSAAETMQLHVRVLEDMIRDLGKRSARHVMNRADLLVLEVMMNLADSYRDQTK